MSQPSISVVIPVWNSPTLIRECLSAIEAQTYPRDAYEVLVVDNGSSDATPDVVRAMPRMQSFVMSKAAAISILLTGLCQRTSVNSRRA